MGYHLRDYVCPRIPTLQGLIIGTAVVGSFTLIPAALKYGSQIVDPLFVLSASAFAMVNTLFLGHSFQAKTVPGTIFASSLYGLGYYGIYKVLGEAVNYVSEKFHLKFNEYYNSDIVSATITFGIVTMAPKPFKEGTMKAISKVAFLIEYCLIKYHILAGQSYYEEIDNDFPNAPIINNIDSNQITPIGTIDDNKENIDYVE